MNQVEDRLTSLLTRTADAIEVEPDIDRVLDPSPAIPLSGPRPARRRSRLLAAGAAASILALGVVVASTVGLSGSDDVETETPVGPTAETEETDTVPRFLVTEQGWQLDHVDEASDDFGEMSFSDGAGNSLQLARYRAEEYTLIFDDRQLGAAGSRTMTIAGQEATVLSTGPGAYGPTFTALWRQGDHGFELRGDTFATWEEYSAIVAEVEEVDETEWLEALPEDVVHPDDRAVEVEQVLEELPIPPGLGTEDILSSMGRPIGTRDELQTATTHAVICEWIHQWIKADETGDSTARNQAVDAMASSREWPLLVAKAGGPWTTYIWDVADAMADDVPLDTAPGIDQGTGYLRHNDCPED